MVANTSSSTPFMKGECNCADYIADSEQQGDHILKMIEVTSRSGTGNLGPEWHYCNLETRRRDYG